jgi:hypothetical protein
MRNVMNYFAAVFIVVALFSLAACERNLDGTDKNAVLAFSEPTIDNLFSGWTANEYAVFARDLDTEIQAALPTANFTVLKQDFDSKLGNYISRQVERVSQADEFYVVDYLARFEHAEPVKITVAFHSSNHSIAGLSITSQKASWSTFD